MLSPNTLEPGLTSTSMSHEQCPAQQCYLKEQHTPSHSPPPMQTDDVSTPTPCHYRPTPTASSPRPYTRSPPPTQITEGTLTAMECPLSRFHTKIEWSSHRQPPYERSHQTTSQYPYQHHHALYKSYSTTPMHIYPHPKSAPYLSVPSF